MQKEDAGGATATPSPHGGEGDRRADFHIDRHGAWYYRGSAVRRDAMVRLFAGMLRKRGSGYVLQTPEQLLRVTVEDAPLLVTDMEQAGEGREAQLWLITNTGERFALDADHPLYLREDARTAEVRAYQLTRDGLSAMVHRNVFYRLAELAVTDAQSGRMGIFSAGRFFALH